jgi:hypothetical protein
MGGRFTVGDKVKFRPTHNTSLQLSGTVKEISPDQTMLLVTAQPDGKAVEVERDFEANAEDCSEAD